MHHHLDALLRERAELVQIAEAVEEARRPGAAAARGLCGLGVPDRLARLVPVAQPGIVRVIDQRPVEPLGCERVLLHRGTDLHERAALRHRAVEVVADRIEAAGIRPHDVFGANVSAALHLDVDRDVPGHCTFADASGTEDDHRRQRLARPVAKSPEIGRVVGRVVTLGHADRRAGNVGLIEELGRVDAAARLAGEVDHALRLIGLPRAVRSARTRADGEARDDRRVDCPGKRDDTLPLLARQDLLVPLGRCLQSFAPGLQVGVVGPGARDPHEAGAQVLRQVDEPRVRQVYGRAFAIDLARRAAIRRPEAAARDFDHLDVVGLETLVDLRELRKVGQTHPIARRRGGGHRSDDQCSGRGQISAHQAVSPGNV